MMINMHSSHSSTPAVSGHCIARHFNSIAITPFYSQNLRRLVSDCSVLGGHSQAQSFRRSSSIALTQESPSRRELKVRCKGKGFGELLQKNKKDKAVERARVDWCPCSRGEILKKYTECCGEYHEGSIEPDAVTLLKARYSAYARGLEPYIVKTHYEGSLDYKGKEQLEKDVHATCEQLRFTKLEITDTQITSNDETFITFKATYSMAGKNISKGQTRFLEEKSRFIKQGDRWLYSDSIPLSQASKAAWAHL